ncbi:MAG: acyloxyacyl hydrolase [Candidatus Omnitrophica bacterium]|nr:acyloxyacyl hydrolase [Candidatus Omnitrophota bacterium]
MHKKFWVMIICILVFSLSFFSICFARDTEKSLLKEIGLFTGYANGDLIDKDDYCLILTIVRLGFDLKPFLNKFNFNPPGLVEFEFEPFANTLISPDPNAEIGFNLLLKYGLPLTQRLYPYLEGGVGFVYTTQHTLEQSTQYNFIPQAGAGIIYFLKKDSLAVTAGYRYRHLSNASIKAPNKGINVDMALVGLSLFY